MNILYGMEYPHWLIIAGTLLVIAGLIGLVIRSKQLAKVQVDPTGELSPEPRPQLPPLPDLLDSRPRRNRRSMLSDHQGYRRKSRHPRLEGRQACARW